jgi:hypothetical protein
VIVSIFARSSPVTLRCSAAGRASKGDGPEIPGRSSFEARFARTSG